MPLDEERIDEALGSFATSLRLAEKHLGDEVPDTMMARYNVATVYNQKGDYAAAALTLAQRAFDWATATFPATHWRVGLLASELGESMSGVGQTEEAIKRLQQAVKVLEASEGPAHLHTVKAMERLAAARGKLQSKQ